jgi:hypothetical protein
MKDEEIVDRAKWLLDPASSMEKLEVELEHVILHTLAEDEGFKLDHIKSNINKMMEELQSYGLVEMSRIEVTTSLIGKEVRFILLRTDPAGRKIPYRMRLTLTNAV